MSSTYAQQTPWRIVSRPDAADFSLAMRFAVAAALLSAAFEHINLEYDAQDIVQLRAPTETLMLVSAMAALLSKYTRIAVAIFVAATAQFVADNWQSMANHTWLFYWTIPFIALVPNWTYDRSYAAYIRITLGMVMLAAATQKLVAGTYLDGAYIAYLSYFGGTTERLFQFLCSEATLDDPCFWHRAIGTFIVFWQIAVGLFLIAGFQSLVVVFLEIAFLLGAGVFADEMNFQVLNIALLCIAFRIGMSAPLFAVCVALLVIDNFTISTLLNDAF